MFSPMKILVLVALLAAVWFVFKAIGRKKAQAEQSVEYDDHKDIEDKK